jgi:hypothetical protein
VKHFLEVFDGLNRLNIEFVSFREQIDTGGPLGRAVVVIIGAIAELERNLIVERLVPACAAPGSKDATSAPASQHRSCRSDPRPGKRPEPRPAGQDLQHLQNHRCPHPGRLSFSCTKGPEKQAP